jgi:hypothetical protein
MKNRPNVAVTAAVAGLLCLPAMIGARSALADEVSDLRANQELLQRRLDQLAQAPRIQAPGAVYGAPGAGPTTVQMMGGSFPRSFLVPGTDTSIRVGGEVRLNMLYWINGGNPGAVHNTNAGATGQSAVIPLSKSGVARTRSDNVTVMSPSQSKISVETRTPTAWGEARSFIEFDFSNNTNLATRPFAISDNLALRLRFAYGTLGPWLGGQANSNFSDPDASMETLSFSGLVGDPGHSRIPQLRYTAPLAPWGFPGAFSVAIEQPESEVWSPATGTCGTFNNPTAAPCNGPTGITKAPAPDVTMAWYIPQPWGHVDFSGVVRPTLHFEDGTGAIDRMYTGWGMHFGGDVKPRWFGWDRDFITWHAVYGEGIGPYHNIQSGQSGLGMVSNFGFPGVTAANATFKPVTSWGGNVGYRRQWLPNLRSNIGIGIYHEDINTLRGAVCSGGNSTAQVTARQAGTAGCGLNKEMVTAAANLIWNLVPFVDVGVEYFWAHRLTVGNQRGDENVLLSRFRVQF